MAGGCDPARTLYVCLLLEFKFVSSMMAICHLGDSFTLHLSNDTIN